MSTERHPGGVSDDTAASDEETTLSDEDWPVAELYRTEPLDVPAASVDADDESGAVVLEQAPAAPGGFRRFPGVVGPRAVAVALAVLLLALLVPAGLWLASRSDDSGEATGDRAPEPTATTPPTSETQDTAPTTAPPAARAIPDVVGSALAEARDELEGADFRVRVRRADSERPEDEVLSQAPTAGTDARPGTIVVLTASGGEARVAVPDVVGMPATKAVRALRDAGLEPSTRRIESDEPPGTVLEQQPAAGEEASEGTAVALRIAAEPATVRVPALVGTRAADARARLRELGLRVTQRPAESSRPPGEVVSQSPAANAELREGGVVTLRVSTGPTGVSVPDVVGLEETAARDELEAAGFAVQVLDEPSSDAAQIGTVLSQDPSAGATRDEGATVTITVARGLT